MSNHPTGDTALARAITTGAPVATNDKQAAELTAKRDVHDPMMREISYEQAIDVLTKQGGDAREVVLVTPTPRPTPGGEWTTRENLLIRGDNFYANASDRMTAIGLAQRLNAADAMEAENKRLRQLLELAAMMSDSKADTLKTWSKFQDAGYEHREDNREGFTEFLHREIAAALRGGA